MVTIQVCSKHSSSLKKLHLAGLIWGYNSGILASITRVHSYHAFRHRGWQEEQKLGTASLTSSCLLASQSVKNTLFTYSSPVCVQLHRSPSYLHKPMILQSSSSILHKGQIGLTVSMPQLGFEDFASGVRLPCSASPLLEYTKLQCVYIMQKWKRYGTSVSFLTSFMHDRNNQTMETVQKRWCCFQQHLQRHEIKTPEIM